MRLKIIDELLEETERVFMAGARLAPGDIRLKKHIETLEKLGEKSPPFAKLADKFKSLYNATEDETGQALLEAAAMLQSIAAVMSDTVPDKPLTAHTGTLTYTKIYPLSYDLYFYMITHNNAENKPIDGSFDYFLDPRLCDYIPEAIKHRKDDKTIPAEAIEKIGSDLIPILTELFNRKKTDIGSKLSILKALHILKFPETYKLACEIYDKGPNYILRAADIIKDYPEGKEFLKKRYAEAVEFAPEKDDYLLVRHRYFGIAMLIFDGLQLVDEYKFWSEKMPMHFSNAINFEYIESYPTEYIVKKITTSDGVNKDKNVIRAWEEIFKEKDYISGRALLNFYNKNDLADYLFSGICMGWRASFGEKRCNDSLHQLYSMFSEKDREKFIQRVSEKGYKNGMIPMCYSCIIEMMKGETIV
jgi:hypothetical protein